MGPWYKFRSDGAYVMRTPDLTAPLSPDPSGPSATPKRHAYPAYQQSNLSRAKVYPVPSFSPETLIHLISRFEREAGM